jgi:hypothetical protein
LMVWNNKETRSFAYSFAEWQGGASGSYLPLVQATLFPVVFWKVTVLRVHIPCHQTNGVAPLSMPVIGHPNTLLWSPTWRALSIGLESHACAVTCK